LKTIVQYTVDEQDFFSFLSFTNDGGGVFGGDAVAVYSAVSAVVVADVASQTKLSQTDQNPR
jgi:hypothetical protein